MKYDINVDFTLLLFGILLTIVFVCLKITNFISWGWLWILSPLWISLGISIIGFILALIALLIMKKFIYKGDF